MIGKEKTVGVIVKTVPIERRCVHWKKSKLNRPREILRYWTRQWM